MVGASKFDRQSSEWQIADSPRHAPRVAGHGIPEDVTSIGFECIPFAALATPPPTTS